MCVCARARVCLTSSMVLTATSVSKKILSIFSLSFLSLSLCEKCVCFPVKCLVCPSGLLTLSYCNKLLTDVGETLQLWLLLSRKLATSHLQELSVGADAILKPGLGAFSRYCSVKPRHPFVCRGGDHLLQLRPLADDSLLQDRSLQVRTQVSLSVMETHKCPVSTFLLVLPDGRSAEPLLSSGGVLCHKFWGFPGLVLPDSSGM